jgi:16S rRNA (uracil1498-N3)-methyltransferase
MRRFFISPEELNANPPAISGPEATHITAVLRMKVGQRVTLFDGTGRDYDAAILSMSKKRVVFRIFGQGSFPGKPFAPVTIAQALLKDGKMDLLVRQLTELGIFELLPFSSERSVANPDPARMATRRNRWEKIVLEAMKQCGRNIPLHIGSYTSFPEILILGNQFIHKILFWEKGETPLQFPSPSFQNETGLVLAVLGPEGGFSDREVSCARECGFITASLGPRILKAETAAVAAAAILQYLFGDLFPEGLS